MTDPGGRVPPERLKGHTGCAGAAHRSRIIRLIWIHVPELEVRGKRQTPQITRTFLPPRWTASLDTIIGAFCYTCQTMKTSYLGERRWFGVTLEKWNHLDKRDNRTPGKLCELWNDVFRAPKWDRWESCLWTTALTRRACNVHVCWV